MTPAAADHFIVVNHLPIVAQDLAGAILAARPDAADRLHLLPDGHRLADFLDSWDDRGRLAVAFLAINDAVLVQDLIARLVPMGVRVILMGDEVEENRYPTGTCQVLRRPFSERDVQAMLTLDTVDTGV